ncbi:hypothetical protein JJD41_22965 [Oxynema sp. CENA135]|uniref:hypothetical protein n=1 Tax=Oxynema sp. CENA135 TaxID=984206 RepID=UPI00190E25F6|nr:hypothetical protein [Oxynema sp. CENA135]MBK4732704.1 hypothetical protein [Oxynema sp. CENA135]
MKKIAIAAFIALIAGFSLSYYYWRQVTTLPDWYENDRPNSAQAVNLSDRQAIAAAQARIDLKIADEIARPSAAETPSAPPRTASRNPFDRSIPIRLDLDNREFNDLLVSSLNETSGIAPFLPATEAFKAEVKAGKVEAGAVVDLGAISVDALTPSERKIYDRALTTFPFLKDRKVYMALQGQPQVDKGKLKFDSKTQVKLGNLNLSLSQIADRLGIPVDRLERQLVLQLERGNLQIEDLELIDDRAAITGILDGDRP